jgi:hypothetical protein
MNCSRLAGIGSTNCETIIFEIVAAARPSKSAYPKADMERRLLHVRFGSKADMCSAQADVR